MKGWEIDHRGHRESGWVTFQCFCDQESVNNMPAYLYSSLTKQIIGLGIKVHKELGPAYEEKLYQRALYLELQRAGLKFEREKEVSINYGPVRIGKKKLDFVIDGKIVVELKKVSQIDAVHKAQVVSYLKATGLKLGLILNFGQERLEIKRVIL